ncbi:MAG: homoserine/homoserine lactone efflux protein [Betaproteobacteria bacterium]|nr:homoserine/homoserine lactone efflux protein [Betaproteobacteria bacterium]
MTLAVWFGFLLAAIVIAVTPGPGAVISMSTGLRHGYGTALVTILGLQAALLTQLLIVALGLGALLATSEMAFSVIKFLGAAYLLWLGIQKWRSPVVPLDANVPATSCKGAFMQGILVNLTNPKAVIFIGALVPQFVDPAQPQAPQYLVIALTLCLTDMLVMSGYALTAARLGRWLRDPRSIRVQNRFFGGLFVSAGALLAISSRSS